MRFAAGLIALIAAGSCWAATIEGDVDPQKLLEWVKYQKAVAGNLKIAAGKTTGFCMKCSDENSQYTGEPYTISLYQVGTKTTGATFFEADMDVDCDGSKDGPCNVSNDPSHQPQLSCNCPANAGKLPFFVIPEGSRFDAAGRGIQLGAVAACIYKDPKTGVVSLAYGPWLDEDGVDQEIGEASAYMAQLLGVDPNPETGGSDTGNTYIIFPGPQGMLTGNDRLDHAKAITMGVANAKKLLADFVSTALRSPRKAAPSFASQYLLVQPGAGHAAGIDMAAGEAVTVFNLNGSTLTTLKGSGARAGQATTLRPGAYAARPLRSQGR